jgi:DinB superfamily
MKFSLEKSIEILDRTPAVLSTLLKGIAQDWTSNNEGKDTWSVYDIIGHLIHGEKTDWVPRAKIILSQNSNKNFEVFDRFAQFEESKEKSLTELLDEFDRLRKENLDWLRSAKITEDDLEKKGFHPAFGEVTLSQLLATWAVHDLNHIAQIARVMSKQYQSAVGPWTAYLKILQS